MSKVYFIKADGLSVVKIGTAGSVAVRLQGLQMASPVKLTLLCTIDGDERLEREMHLRFEQYRLHGEWFTLDGDLLEYVEGVMGAPPSVDRYVWFRGRDGLVWKATPAQFFRWMEFLFGPDWPDYSGAVGITRPQMQKWIADAGRGICSIPPSALRNVMEAHKDKIVRLKAKNYRARVGMSQMLRGIL